MGFYENVYYFHSLFRILFRGTHKMTYVTWQWVEGSCFYPVFTLQLWPPHSAGVLSRSPNAGRVVPSE